MKNLLLTLFFATSIQSFSKSFSQSSSFEIFSNEKYITVAIDKEYFPEPTNHFSMLNILPGNHFIEIYEMRKENSGNFLPNKFRKQIFSGYVNIDPSSSIQAVIDYQNIFSIRSITPLFYETHICEPVVNPMPAELFKQLLSAVDNQWYDDDKLAIAKQAAYTNILSTKQVKELMDLFWYENNKLDFAKAAYSTVIDPGNYFLVYEEFWYSNSVDELISYISTFK